jgi:hypothetical protein
MIATMRLGKMKLIIRGGTNCSLVERFNARVGREASN